jgi:formate dehydrogenase major subunit
MNPAGSMPNTKHVREAMRKLKWMVVSDFYETESACIWQAASDEGVDPKDVETEVFLLPAASAYEKEGSFANTGRWIQWRDQAVEPYGDAMSDGHIVNHLFWEIRELYEREGGVYPDPIVKLDWSYTKAGPFVRTTTRTDEFDTEAIAREINGYALADLTDEKTGATIKAGAQLPSFVWYRDDGSVAGGCWIYAGYYGPKGNTARKRELDDPTGLGLYPNWSFSWPVNRRVLYNRAGVDPTGKPWSPEHASTRWDPDAVNAPNPNGTPVPNGKWVGDVPDGGGAPGAIRPFIMRAEGVARLWGNGTADAALPEHYEPYESPVRNPFSSVQVNPCVKRFDTIDPEFTKIARFGTAEAERFPYVMNTIRLTEHFLSGASTRNARMLAQLQPELFVELSPELAKLERLSENDLVVVESRRARVVARVKVTPRQRPMTVAGKTLHVVGMPFHWGYKGFVTGGTTNDHLHDLGDPNTGIQEDKHILVRLDRPTASDMARYRQILAEARYDEFRPGAKALAAAGTREG